MCLDEFALFEGRASVEYCDHGEIVARHTELVSEMLEVLEILGVMDERVVEVSAVCRREFEVVPV